MRGAFKLLAPVLIAGLSSNLNAVTPFLVQADITVAARINSTTPSRQTNPIDCPTGYTAVSADWTRPDPNGSSGVIATPYNDAPLTSGTSIVGWSFSYENSFSTALNSHVYVVCVL